MLRSKVSWEAKCTKPVKCSKEQNDLGSKVCVSLKITSNDDLQN